jgi:uncharacterized membrane protein
MTLLEYLALAAGAWFMGFFPLAEIIVAVPAATAAGLDDVSVIVWTVFGNFTPVVLITLGYDWIARSPYLRAWLTRLASEKARARMDHYGVWFVLLVTPWTGVWVMSVAAKALGMRTERVLMAAGASILIYAVAVLLLVRFGAGLFASA